MCATQNSDGMQLAGFSKKLNIHKFKCNGKALEADGLNLRFRKLLETTPAEKAYMDNLFIIRKLTRIIIFTGCSAK